MKMIVCLLLVLTLSSCVHDWSRKDKRLLAWSTSAMMADIATTNRGVEQGYVEVGIPKYIIGERPSTTDLVLFGAGSQALIIWLADKFEDWRPWLLATTAAAHSGAAVYNYNRIDGRGDE